MRATPVGAELAAAAFVSVALLLPPWPVMQLPAPYLLRLAATAIYIIADSAVKVCIQSLKSMDVKVSAADENRKPNNFGHVIEAG